MTTSIKIYCDVDYLVYLDKDKNIVGFEITPDDISALALRYNSEDEKVVTMFPQGTEFILEVFAINSLVMWAMTDDPKGGKAKGKLFFYKPRYQELSQEIVREIEHAYPIEEEPKTEKPQSSLEIFLRKKLPTIPYTGWMNDFYGTSFWMQIWRTHPELQEAMLECVKNREHAKSKFKSLVEVQMVQMEAANGNKTSAAS